MPLIKTLRKVLLLSVIAIAGLAAVTFVADYGILQLRIASGRNPYGSVTVRHYYAVGEKGNKTEYIFDPPQEQTCVNSLFPHGGDAPCWYLRRHPEQRTDI